MKVSVSWLAAALGCSIDIDACTQQLTMAGLEIDAVTPCSWDVDGWCVVRVNSVAPHHQGWWLELDTGDGCHATYTQVAVAPGDRLLWAPEGAQVQGTTVHAQKIADRISSGRLCGWSDLGLSTATLVRFDSSTPLGPARSLWPTADTILDVAITPNRGDCLSVHGLAREVAALSGDVWQAPAPAVVPVSTEAAFAIHVLDRTACPLLIGRQIDRLDLKRPLPTWLLTRLLQSGLNSVNPVVDVLNHVMLLCGQPMHAYDADALVGDLTVRSAQDGDVLTLLHGQEVVVHPGTLVVVDEAGPVALAGVMGGARAAVTSQTTRVVLESAHFVPEAIRGCARRYGLNTDAAYRFERGVDPEQVAWAMEQASHHLLILLGGEASSVVQVATDRSPPSVIDFDPCSVQQRLGLNIEADAIQAILIALGFVVRPETSPWQVMVPSYRFDVKWPEDLLEEVIRVHGYDDLPVQPLTAAMVPPASFEPRDAIQRLRTYWVDAGYFEVIHYSFTDYKEQAPWSQAPALRLSNPLHEELAVMRQSLWPQLLKAAAYNQRRQQSDVRLFECGPVFLGDRADQVQQSTVLAGLAMGGRVPEQWGQGSSPLDLFDVKRDIDRLLALSGHPPGRWQHTEHAMLQPGQAAELICHQQPVAWLGMASSQVLQTWELKAPVVLFHILLTPWMQPLTARYQALTKHPTVRRDLSLVVPKKVQCGDLEACIWQLGCDFLQSVTIFDVYEGGQYRANHQKSLALALTLQGISRTLTEQDVEPFITKVVEALQQRFEATLRDGR